MDGKFYSSTTVEKCLSLAMKELGVDLESLKYTVIEEKRGIFRKSATIKVECSVMDLEEKEAVFEEESKNKNGSIIVKDGKIEIENPMEEGTPVQIAPSDNMILIVNGEEVKSKVEVFKEDKIEVKFLEENAKRNLNIYVSEDNMKATIDITYEPKHIYKLKDSGKTRMLILREEVANKIYPPKFSIDEIKNELNAKGITYGIIEENLEKASKENDLSNMIIAEGKFPVDDEMDIIDIKFKTSEKNLIQEDENGRIDYKDIGAIEAVKIGEILAIKTDGKPGEDGINIKGITVKHKIAKKPPFRCGKGCKLVEDNQIVSVIEGKPSFSNGVFNVSPVYEIKGDVNLKTGNIKFLGDIIVQGNVLEGMKVEAGGSLAINKNIESAEIKAIGNIDINGNIILSTIYGGGNDVLKLQYLNDLSELQKYLESMVKTILEIKKFNLLGRGSSDGELVKALMENKFKIIPRICAKVIRDSILEHDLENEVVQMLKSKLIGLAPLNIKHYNEINDIIGLIKTKIDELEVALNLPVNVNLNYCQDCNISSSGNICFKGKGEYVSNITANNSVYFEREGSIARGGIIKAKNEIKCKTVGSIGGVSTKLVVGSKGHIWVDTAYQNTIFVIGEREHLLEVPSRNIHAYIDGNGEFMVDKLKL